MNKLAAKGLKVALKIVSIQFLIIIAVTILGLIFKDVKTANSILVGGLSAVIPNGILAIFLFSTSGASRVHTTVRRFYRGTTLKLILSSTLLALAMKTGLIIPWLFIGFIIAIFAHIFTPVSIT